MNKLKNITLSTLLLASLAVKANEIHNLGDDGPSNSNHLTCLTSPITDLKNAVRNSDSDIIQNYFGNINEEDQFTSRLDFSILLSEKERFMLLGPQSNTYQKEFDQFITMLTIEAAFEKGNDVSENYARTIKRFLKDKPGHQMADGFFNLNYELVNNVYGTEVLNYSSQPHDQKKVKRVIRNLESSELCTNGQLIDQSSFVELVRNKLD